MSQTLAPALTLREATLDDVAPIQAMFAEFVSSTAYAQWVGNNPIYSAAMIKFLIESDDGTVFVADDDGVLIGMCGVLVYTDAYSGERVASESFWWLNPDRRGFGPHLLKRAEKWCKARGAVFLSMMQPFDKPRVGEIYAKLGYSPVEVIFRKDLR